MLYFVVPLKSRIVAGDWHRTCQLLERTLMSICGQSCPNYHVLVVCHERPDFAAASPRVEFLPAPFDPPPGDTLGLSPNERLPFLRRDKGLKALTGLDAVRKRGGDYVMLVDGDDLVSRRLAALAEEHPHPNGWCIRNGYMMYERFPRVVYPRRRFHEECGSSNVLRALKAPFPDAIDYRKGIEDFYVRRYVTHAYIADNMTRIGAPLARCPFPGAIYVRNDQSIYARHCRRGDSRMRLLLRLLVKGRPVTERLRREFGLAKRAYPVRGAE